MILTTLAGLGFGLSLIVAIGAQNAYVLRQGLRREHVLAVVIVCAASDAVLILVGVAGFGALIRTVPWLLVVVRIVGAAFLLGYAALAARRAVLPRPLDTSVVGTAASLTQVLATTAALTWLNPHVYLDTVVFLGSVAAAHGDERWYFGLGAVLGSVIWFTALGFGARLLRPVFGRPVSWRILDIGIAVIMTVIAVSLLLGIGT
ncbi:MULTISPECIES: LysE/ArgO family amino acid transporter [unclassified Cryobacterium]|uniref:LysE/ArgO family amino acid transporter n=1 Tax=unclassified Cryobacterium TaxID=2649013 RepID=UPI0010697772|nr:MULTISPECIES: LysE/ArgO family amino acid transporter [unclassified Cryobacterium]MDY7527652.1 LysE/ArgO family amino acid transporter [Cryobacterium sp. 10C2]MDY7556571.1 LysE/ArgO family amino acid transporter [Cryobacterium sp. 10C3]MEB0002831.1 LysE/ArgO family amino acid transporter [Cryobacterium sp. RTC2.1]MEB0288960.1 LysE/ArgO family amino acid transporter [Cryobacterium sp. 10C2]TFC32842.1 amino acid transporter [Cryobacterium sp. MDB1-18-2]